MKKILVAIAAVALLLLPLTAMAAMNAVSDGELDGVVGQTGITILPWIGGNITVTSPGGTLLDNLNLVDDDGFQLYFPNPLPPPTNLLADYDSSGYINVNQIDLTNLTIGLLPLALDAGITIDVGTDADDGGWGDIPLPMSSCIAIGVPGMMVNVGLDDLTIGSIGVDPGPTTDGIATSSLIGVGVHGLALQLLTPVDDLATQVNESIVLMIGAH